MSLFAVVVAIALIGMMIVPVQTVGIDNGSDKNSSGPTEGTITGQVTDAESGEPIQEVLMTLEYHHEVRFDLTDANGQYIFTNVPICFCLKDITAAKVGYESQTQSVGVHELTYVNFSLEPSDDSEDPDEPDEPEPDEPEDPEDPEPDEPDEPEPDEPEPEDPEPDEPEPDDDNGAINGILTGFVIDALTNEPISDVLVMLKYHEDIRRMLTDLDGKYTFTQVPICFCLKEVTAQKDGYETEEALVGVSEITYVNFTLEQDQAAKDDAENIPDRDDLDAIHGQNDNTDKVMESSTIYLIFISAAGIFAVVILVGIFISGSKFESQ